ncbi:MAG: hypothetical protein CMJ18_16895 [Phycisphaeraceae bacterium]|nr:hypothetical protein [Phycisphaeraceae bacterium]
MGGKRLLLIGADPPQTGAGLVDQVLGHWAGNPDVSIERLEAQRLLEDPAPLDGCAVAWVVADSPDPDYLEPLTRLLHDRHVVAMLTRPGETSAPGAPYRDGLVCAPPQSHPAGLAAVLAALWCQADMIRALRTELSMLQLQHGGVVHEFDKLDEELRHAARLQREFLPARMPSHPGVSFDVLYRPTGYVSGDIYDVMQLDERHIGFFLADAVGHGVPAAMMTIYIKSTLNVRRGDALALGDQRIEPPAHVMARLNHDLIEYQQDQVLTATAVYGIIDTETFELVVARGGHPYPLVVRPDGSMKTVESEGALLGVFPDEQFEQTTLHLEPGDRVVFYSDGFELAFPPPGRSRSRMRIANDVYLDEFRHLARGSVEEALARLDQRLDEQTGSLNQQDDLTVLLAGVGDSMPIGDERAELVAHDEAFVG